MTVPAILESLPAASEIAGRVLALSIGAWLLATLLRHRPARQRVALWSLLFSGVALAPLLSLLPGWRLPGLESSSAIPENEAVSEALLVTPPTASEDRALPTDVPEAELLPTVTAAPIEITEPTPVSWSEALVGIWLVIALAKLTALGLGLRRARGLTRQASPDQTEEWRLLVNAVASTVGLTRTPALHFSGGVSSPMTGGWLKPFVLLPIDARSWPKEQRRVVLMHELTHIRRHDWIALIAARFLCSVYWFDPFLWAAWRRARLEREKACDEAVIANGISASLYARQLMTVALQSSHSRGLATLAMARRSELEERLMSLVRQARPRQRGAAALWPLLGLTTLIFSVGTARWTQPDPEDGLPVAEVSEDDVTDLEVQGDLTIRSGRLSLGTGTVCWMRTPDESRQLRLERRSDGRVTARYWEDDRVMPFSPRGRAWLKSVLERYADGPGLRLSSREGTARSTLGARGQRSARSGSGRAAAPRLPGAKAGSTGRRALATEDAPGLPPSVGRRVRGTETAPRALNRRGADVAPETGSGSSRRGARATETLPEDTPPSRARGRNRADAPSRSSSRRGAGAASGGGARLPRDRTRASDSSPEPSGIGVGGGAGGGFPHSGSRADASGSGGTGASESRASRRRATGARPTAPRSDAEPEPEPRRGRSARPRTRSTRGSEDRPPEAPSRRGSGSASSSSGPRSAGPSGPSAGPAAGSIAGVPDDPGPARPSGPSAGLRGSRPPGPTGSSAGARLGRAAGSIAGLSNRPDPARPSSPSAGAFGSRPARPSSPSASAIGSRPASPSGPSAGARLGRAAGSIAGLSSSPTASGVRDSDGKSRASDPVVSSSRRGRSDSGRLSGSAVMTIVGLAEVHPRHPFGVEPRPGSRVDLVIRDGGVEHALTLTCSRDGEQESEYRADGEVHALDEAARRRFRRAARPGISGTLSGELRWELRD